MGIRFMVVLAGLAWQCCAIQINVDTVFTSNGTRFTIKNTSNVDTVYIDSVYVHNLSPLMVCTEIGFQDSVSQRFEIIYKVRTINDSMFVAASTYRMSIAPRDSLVLTNAGVGSCLMCVGVQARNYGDQCILKATFVPNKGAKDSVVFIGPRISGGTKFKTHSNLPVFGKGTAAMKLYDLSGRCIDKMTGRKTGVYIATYGRQGALLIKLMMRD